MQTRFTSAQLWCAAYSVTFDVEILGCLRTCNQSLDTAGAAETESHALSTTFLGRKNSYIHSYQQIGRALHGHSSRCNNLLTESNPEDNLISFDAMPTLQCQYSYAISAGAETPNTDIVAEDAIDPEIKAFQAGSQLLQDCPSRLNIAPS